ncbi:MAG: serine/threonine protein kinase [Sulfolobaceae archaeon]
MVEVKFFIYPRYSVEIERELREHGITHLISFGRVNIGRVNVIGKGKTGIIALLDDNKVIKIRRTDSPKETLEIEAKIQKLAYPSAPYVYEYGKNFIIMEFINGRYLSKNENLKIIIDLIERAYYLELKNIEHKELNRPWKNVLVSDLRTWIIDYDSASIKENAKNIQKILSAFGYIDLAKKYSKNILTKNEIIRLLQESFSY